VSSIKQTNETAHKNTERDENGYFYKGKGNFVIHATLRVFACSSWR